TSSAASTNEATSWTVTAATPPPWGEENGLSPGLGTGTTTRTDSALATPSVVASVARLSPRTGTVVSQRPLSASETPVMTNVTGSPVASAPSTRPTRSSRPRSGAATWVQNAV